MGLDISYYRQVSLIEGATVKDGEAYDTSGDKIEWDKYMVPYANADFEGRIGSLETGRAYRYEDCDGFRAGAYSAYNRWRNSLAEIAGWPEGEYEQYGTMWKSYCVECWNGAQGPFAELINFSDCDGTIGPEVSAKLAKDFEKFQANAEAYPDEGFRAKYALFRAAFETASDGGCVDFH